MKISRKGLIVSVCVAAVLALSGITAYKLGEDLKPRESDLAKYPELTPFLAGRSGFRGIRFNVDTNEFVISFPTTLKTQEAYFAAVESAAAQEGWKLASTSQSARVYRRPSDRYAAASHEEKVTLSYVQSIGEVTLVFEQDYSDGNVGTK